VRPGSDQDAVNSASSAAVDDRTSRKRVLVLSKKSALRVHLEGRDVGRHARVEELLRTRDVTVQRMMGAHEQHERTLAEVQEALAALGCDSTTVTAAELDEFRIVDPRGHGIGETPVLAINSAPDFSVGFFCGARAGGVRAALEKALDGRLHVARLTRMQVVKNDVVLTTRVLNEALVCCASPAATTRYLLEHQGLTEEQKSSGIWIGPAAGSTAAQRSAGGRVLPLGSSRLQFVVREPYTPAGRRLRLRRALVEHGDALTVRVKMSDGRIFVDGPHEVWSVTIGDVLRFSASEEPLHLLGVARRKGWTAKRTSKIPRRPSR
jgi:NAD+ kinase